MENKQNERSMFIPYDIISNLPRKEAVVLTIIFETSIDKGYSSVTDDFLSSMITGSNPDEINDVIDDLSRRNTLKRYFNSNNHRLLELNPEVSNIYENIPYYQHKNTAYMNIPSDYVSIENENKNFNGLFIPSEIKLSIDYRYIPLLAIIVSNSKNDGYIRMDKLSIIADKFNITNFHLNLKELTVNEAINCYTKEGEVAIISPSSWTALIYGQYGIHLPKLVIPEGFTLFTRGIDPTPARRIPYSKNAHYNDSLRIPIEIQNEIDYKYWIPFVQFVRTTEKTGAGRLGVFEKLLKEFTKEALIDMFKYLYGKKYVNIYSKFYYNYSKYSFRIVLSDKVDNIYSNYYDLYIHKPKLNDTTYKQINLPTFLKESKGD